MTTSKPETATVETLTAAVHVLMIGNRQITLSIAKQLDEFLLTYAYQPGDFKPFGRIRTGLKVFVMDYFTDKRYSALPECEFIGSNRAGELVRVVVDRYSYLDNDELRELAKNWEKTLPLIVLAGLR